MANFTNMTKAEKAQARKKMAQEMKKMDMQTGGTTMFKKTGRFSQEAMMRRARR